MTNQSDKHLKLWLKLEEGTGTTANDALKTNNGTLSGSGTSWLAGGRPARDGKYCVAFDGTSNNHIILSNSSSQFWDGASSFTVALWALRVGDNTAASAQFAFSHPVTATNNRIYIQLGTTSASVSFNVGSTSFGTTAFTNGEWIHIALSHNASTGISYGYINGKLVGSTSTPLGTLVTNCFIGANQQTTNQVMKGYVDDVRFYTRFMNEAEVKSIIHGAGYAK